MRFEDLPDETRNFFFDKASEILQDYYHCKRVWEAWSVGTMSEDDFILAREDDDIVSETADMLFQIVKELKNKI